jgi:hypothetical protein
MGMQGISNRDRSGTEYKVGWLEHRQEEAKMGSAGQQGTHGHSEAGINIGRQR